MKGKRMKKRKERKKKTRENHTSLSVSSLKLTEYQLMCTSGSNPFSVAYDTKRSFEMAEDKPKRKKLASMQQGRKKE